MEPPAQQPPTMSCLHSLAPSSSCSRRGKVGQESWNPRPIFHLGYPVSRDFSEIPTLGANAAMRGADGLRGQMTCPSWYQDMTGTSSGHKIHSAQLQQSSNTAVSQQCPQHISYKSPPFNPSHTCYPMFIHVQIPPHAPSLERPYSHTYITTPYMHKLPHLQHTLTTESHTQTSHIPNHPHIHTLSLPSPPTYICFLSTPTNTHSNALPTKDTSLYISTHIFIQAQNILHPHPSHSPTRL